MNTFKTFTKTIARCAAIVITATLLAVHGNPAKASGGKHTGADTSRRNVVLIQGDGIHNSDSMEYVINGKKSTHQKFEELKFDDILSVNWVSAENAAKIFENEGLNVLFVTTRNSEEGKKILDKVNTVKNNKGQVFSTKKHAVYEVSDGTLREIQPDDAGVITLTGNNKTYADSRPMVITAGGAGTISANSSKPYVYAVSSSGNLYGDATAKTYRRSANAHRDIFSTAGDQYTSVSELSDLKDKLVIINDKEATANDLKKISAFDIDKMNFKDDDYTRDRYGDKAKNGVVYIYTKKAKK